MRPESGARCRRKRFPRLSLESPRRKTRLFGNCSDDDGDDDHDDHDYDEDNEDDFVYKMIVMYV